MSTLESLLAALPDDPMTAFVLADYLEEQSDPRGEVLRLAYTLTRTHKVRNRSQLEDRLRELLYQDKVVPLAPTLELKLSRTVPLVLAWIPPGQFRMGSPVREAGHASDERLHQVTLTRGFWMSVFPITQVQWMAIQKSNPSDNVGATRPVDNISFDLATQFCKATSTKLRRTIRLPTEAEWEYACRAGTTTCYHYGPKLEADLARITMKSEDHERGTAPVGSYAPNAFGLYDMHGNVYEWVSDRWDEDYYLNSPEADPTGPKGSEARARVLRGGSWYYDVSSARSAHRIECTPAYGYIDMGFRVVCDHE